MKSAHGFWGTYGFPLVVIFACIVTTMALRGKPGSSTTDFLVFYESGRQALDGTDPYLPFVAERGPNLNPPWIVLLMSPLSRAPLPAAVGLWWAFSFACLGTAAALIAKAVAPGQAVAIASMVLLTQSAYSNIRLGQVAWPVMLLLTIAWHADRSHRQRICGFALGLAVSWKPFLLVFVPYLIWRRSWVALGSLVAAVGTTVGVGMLAFGAAIFASWITAMRTIGWGAHLLNGSLAGLVSRAYRLLPPTQTPRVLVWLALAGALIGVTAWRLRASRRVDVAWASLPLLALLLSPLGWVHYVPIAAGPLAAMIRTAPRSAVRLGVAGWLLVCNPLAWMLPTDESGLAMMLTLGSSYTWGILLLLTAVLVAGHFEADEQSALSPSRQQRSGDVWPAAHHDRAR